MHSVQPRVADHYNKIVQKSREERQHSEILGVKRFNNWVKSVLIQRFSPPQAVALDLCCGKGGDLQKFRKANVREYVGADHALQSIKDAMQRYNEFAPLPFPATFICADCHTGVLSDALPAGLLFDLVSCQFALHYSFESESRARTFARNIAERLKPGGTFVATFPNADALQHKLAAAVEVQREKAAERAAVVAASGSPPEAPRPLRLEFGNSVYRVKFTSPCPLVQEPHVTGPVPSSPSVVAAPAPAPASASASSSSVASLSLPPPPPLPVSPFGVQYTFDLTDAIAECPEYMVSLPALQSLLWEYGCELLLASPLHTFFLEHAGHEEYGRLLKLMKVLGSDYERPPTEDEWEVLNVYMAVAFRKRMPGELPGSHPSACLADAPLAGCLQRPLPPATQHPRDGGMQSHARKLTHADIKHVHAPAQAAPSAAVAAQ